MMMYLDGDFSFWNNKNSENYCAEMYRLLNENNGWHLLELLPEGWNPFDITDIPDLNDIVNQSKYGHSGFTIMWTVAQMVHIHKMGWIKYVQSRDL